MADLGGGPELPDGQRIEARVTDFVVRLTFLGLFCFWAMQLVRPFLPVMIWSVLLTVALYPAYGALAGWLGGRKAVAAALITAIAMVTVLGPISVLATSLVESVTWLAGALKSGSLKIPPPPASVEAWPLVGGKVDEIWALASDNIDDAMQRYGPALLPAGSTVLGKIASIGTDAVLFVVSVVISGFLFVPGPRLAAAARIFAGRLIAPRGAHFVDLAGATIRNVSRGVVGVALIQALLAGITLMGFGVPGAGLIAFASLLLCIVQIGPAPVLLPVIVWAWATHSTAWALALSLCLVPVVLIDNVLKPLLMGRGLTTPLLVILVGVIGGTLTHGLIGLFLGPIILAVFYELVVAWVQLGPAATPEAPGPAGAPPPPRDSRTSPGPSGMP